MTSVAVPKDKKLLINFALVPLPTGPKRTTFLQKFKRISFAKIKLLSLEPTIAPNTPSFDCTGPPITGDST